MTRKPDSTIGDKVNSLVYADEWDEARKVIKIALKTSPEDHWLLARLSLTYYEQFEYDKAYEVALKAFRYAPQCPMVLWELAGALEMLDRQREAIVIYRRLVKRGVAKIAFGDCGEGLARARGLVADCLYRLGTCYEFLRNKVKAAKYYEQHLAQRGPGCHSVYSIKEVRKEYKNLLEVR